MVSIGLHKKLSEIAAEALRMVSVCIDPEDITDNVSYLSIYAQSNEEFDTVSKELVENGTVVFPRDRGNYYKLHEPIAVGSLAITICRVRRFDGEHTEHGYLDFEPKDYQSFKEKYASRPGYTVLTTGEEMIELRDSRFNVRAYFPSRDF